MQLKEPSQTETQQTLKVLIADDDPPTRVLLRAAISQWGYEAVVAGDGEEAWQILQQPEAPKLLILDWLMPKLDGIELCTRIRKELNYHPYIVLLTQVAGTENIIKGLEAGADEFLSKPFNMAELRSRLSVGARIIQYVTQLELIAKLVDHISKIVNEIEKTQEPATSSGKMHELQEELNSFVTIIQRFQNESTKR